MARLAASASARAACAGEQVLLGAVGGFELGGALVDPPLQFGVEGADLVLGPLALSDVAHQPAHGDRVPLRVTDGGDGQGDVAGFPLARLEARPPLDPSVVRPDPL